MHVAISLRVVCANRQQGYFWRELLADLSKPGEVSCVSRVINGVLALAQNISSITAMRILDNAGTPMAGRHVSHSHAVMTKTAPPVQFHNLIESQIRHQIKHVMRHDCGRGAAHAARVLRNRPQGRAMQVIEVSVRDQHQINGRQVAHFDAGSF